VKHAAEGGFVCVFAYCVRDLLLLFVDLAMCRPVTIQKDEGVSFDRLFSGLECMGQ
jgi:hypothetical protein